LENTVELRKAIARGAEQPAAGSHIILRLVGGEPATRALRLLKAHSGRPADGRPIIVALVLAADTEVPEVVPDREMRFGDVAIDFGARVVTRAGQAVELTPRQFDLLAALVRSDGQALTRQQLIRHAWPDAGDSGARTVDTHIWHLRHRLESDAAAPRYIVTVKKVGYRFQR
jgi:DNA-binding response OmpR family regulator